MLRALRILIPLLIVGGVAYAYRGPLSIFALQAYQQIAPCTYPISYTIGAIDTRFNISRAHTQEAIEKAEIIWEKAAGKELFRRVNEGAVLTIDLVYDTRQETTEKLKELGLSVNNDAASYDAVKAKYEAVLREYNAQKAALEAQRTLFEKEAAQYESRVAAANARGGATPAEYAALNLQKERLLDKERELQHAREEVNASADSVNTLIATLNKLAASLNATASEYNETGSTVGDEFEEAIFQSSPGKEEIHIYEFDSMARLQRVLAHEFGHALGLEHVDDAKAIMYRLNQSKNTTPSRADISELKRACRIEG